MQDIVCRRGADHTVRCNIPQRHIHASPTGFEVGYGGSGPADLALNILAMWLPLPPGEEGVRCWDGSRVSEAAWDLHQAFKREFVATMDRRGGTIPGVVIEAWVTAKRVGVE